MNASINHIDMPYEHLETCEQWHGGQGCMLYAVASSGGLFLGNRRPYGCDTDEKWYLKLWMMLDADLSNVSRLMKKQGDVTPEIQELMDFVSMTVEKLREEYGLQDWEGE